MCAPPPPLCKHSRSPRKPGKQRFNTHPMLSHNPTMVLTLRHHTSNISVCRSREHSGAAATILFKHGNPMLGQDRHDNKAHMHQ